MICLLERRLQVITVEGGYQSVLEVGMLAVPEFVGLHGVLMLKRRASGVLPNRR